MGSDSKYQRFKVGKVYHAKYYHFGTLLYEADFLVTRRGVGTGKVTVQEIHRGKPYGKKYVKGVYSDGLRRCEALYDVGVFKFNIYASEEVY